MGNYVLWRELALASYFGFPKYVAPYPVSDLAKKKSYCKLLLQFAVSVYLVSAREALRMREKERERERETLAATLVRH
jgi:hypothetical protein